MKGRKFKGKELKVEFGKGERKKEDQQSGQCYNCHKDGHYARECTQRRKEGYEPARGGYQGILADYILGGERRRRDSRSRSKGRRRSSRRHYDSSSQSSSESYHRRRRSPSYDGRRDSHRRRDSPRRERSPRRRERSPRRDSPRKERSPRREWKNRSPPYNPAKKLDRRGKSPEYSRY